MTLSSPRDFANLQRAGTTRSHSLLLARIARTDREETRFGFAIGRKLGGAVVRNRIRRRLREILRAMLPTLAPGWDVLIVAKPGIETADHPTLVAAVRKVLERGGVVDEMNERGRTDR